MKTLLLLLLSVTIARAQTVEVYNSLGRVTDYKWENKATQIFLSGIFGFPNASYGRWIAITRNNTDTLPRDDKGFEPDATVILCKLKPIVSQRPDGNYVITFNAP